MAISLQGPTTWFTNSDGFDTRTFDIEQLENGQVLFAFGGSSSVNPALHTALINLGTGQIGAIDTTTWTPTEYSGTVRRIDITPGNAGGALLTLHSTFSSAGGADSNFSLVTLPSQGGAARNVEPLPVNPGAPDENTHDAFATVHLAGGGYAVFFTEPGSKSMFDLSNGIRMARFDETGHKLGPTKRVIGETVVNTLMNLENNPEQPSAVLMNNGHIGLYYKENTSTGNTRFLFQELSATGAKIGRALTVVEGAINPGIQALDNGTLLATWFDVVTGQHRARILDAAGDSAGRGFGLSTAGLAPYSYGDLVTLGDGFAFGWSDTTTGLFMAQLFDATGKAKSNPFLVTDTAGEFNGGVGGLFRVDDGFAGFVLGAKAGSYTQILEGQVFSGASSLGITRNGKNVGETLNGTAKDDTLNLRSGNDVSDAGAGNDIQIGGKGNDRLSGGVGFDRIDGGQGNDSLDGGAGIDILVGGAGNDRLTGGDGADRLTGDMGRDTMTGGAGADVFIFSGPGDVMTTVTDFNAAEGDKLKILAASYGYLGFFGPTIGTDPHPTASGLYFNTNTHILSQDRDGAGTLYERVNIAYLLGVTTVGISDLLTF